MAFIIFTSTNISNVVALPTMQLICVNLSLKPKHMIVEDKS